MGFCVSKHIFDFSTNMYRQENWKELTLRIILYDPNEKNIEIE